MDLYQRLNLILLFLTLRSLVWYACEARLVRNAMLVQIATMRDQREAQDRPYLTAPLGTSGMGGGHLMLYNERNGTAFSCFESWPSTPWEE